MMHCFKKKKKRISCNKKKLEDNMKEFLRVKNMASKIKEVKFFFKVCMGCRQSEWHRDDSEKDEE